MHPETETAVNVYEEMLNELQSHQLVTILAPSKRHDRRDWDMIRVNADENVKWYRKLCADHPSSRRVRRGKFDTKIRRANVLRQLELMIEGRYSGKYLDALQCIAKSR